MRNKLTLLLLTALAFRAGAQSEPLTFSLQEAQDYAAAHAYTVLDKSLEYEKARKTIKETAAIGLPQISASFGYSYNAQIPEQPIPAQFFDPTAGPDEFTTVAFGVAHQNQAQVQLTQLLFDGSYFVALQATRVFKETKRLEQEEAAIEARKNTAQSYYGALMSEKMVNIFRDNLTVLDQNLKEVSALFENGFVEDQDVSQLQLLVNNVRNNLRNAERQHDLALKLLKFNMGLPLQAEVALSTSLDNLIASSQQGLALSYEEFNLEQHISYRSLLSQERGAILQMNNEKAKYLPSLGGFVNHSQSNFANDFDQAFSFNTFWIPGTTIGASLNWDLFTGLGRQARVQKAKIDVDRLQVAKATTRAQLSMQYEQALSDYVFALDNLQNQESNRQLSERIRNRTMRKYQEGLSSSLDFTQAQNQYLDAERNYINALLNLLNAKEALEYALGK